MIKYGTENQRRKHNFNQFDKLFNELYGKDIGDLLKWILNQKHQFNSDEMYNEIMLDFNLWMKKNKISIQA
jgi:hypothetical protein